MSWFNQILGSLGGGPSIKSIYIAGSLRNPDIPIFANEIEALGFEAFADWKSPGPAADDFLKEYSQIRGRNYQQTLDSYAAKHVFEFDRHHLDRCDATVMLMPAGKSCCIELGVTLGKGKPGYIVFPEEPQDRIDVMFQFATRIFYSKQEFLDFLKTL